MSSSDTRSVPLSLSLRILSVVFGVLAFIGTIRAIYNPSPGLLLSIFIFSVAAVALAAYLLRPRSSRSRRGNE